MNDSRGQDNNSRHNNNHWVLPEAGLVPKPFTQKIPTTSLRGGHCRCPDIQRGQVTCSRSGFEPSPTLSPDTMKLCSRGGHSLSKAGCCHQARI